MKQGKDGLYKSALQGKPGTAMVAKGGFANLSDDDVKAVVDLMIAKAK
jgi:cytochrome c5